MPMKWSFDINRTFVKEIWLFEVARALGTAAMAKAWRGLDSFPKKSVSWKLVSAIVLKCHLILLRVL